MPEEITSGNSYYFAGIMVDGENFRVLKSEKDLMLSPKAFDVLIYLLKNKGRVVEKQELFENIWKDTFVADNALTRVIKEIRQSLDDDAINPRYIETVTKRGYRFIAEVTHGNIESSSDLDSNQNSLRFAWFNRYLLTSSAVIVAVVALVIGSIVVSEFYSEYKATHTPIDSIAVLPFKIEPQNDEIKAVAENYAEDFSNSLTQIPDLRVLPRNPLQFYQNSEEDPQTIGRALRVRAVLTGKVTQNGNDLSIQLEIVDTQRKDQVWGQKFTCPIAESDVLQKEISIIITDRLKTNVLR